MHLIKINVFNEASHIYNEALKKSGFGHNIEFIGNETNNRENSGRRKKRTRKGIWFNPPYSKNVKTNVGKYFIQLIQKTFPQRPQTELDEESMGTIAYPRVNIQIL